MKQTLTPHQNLFRSLVNANKPIFYTFWTIAETHIEL